MESKRIAIDSVRPDPNQPRKYFSEGHINGLVKSLKAQGQIHPIEVDANNMIIVGECRWRAARKAGWTEIEARVNTNKLNPYERFTRQLHENIHTSGDGEPMNPIDLGRAYKWMLEQNGHKLQPGCSLREGRLGSGISELARQLGVSRTHVQNKLNLLSQPKWVLEDIQRGIRTETIYRDADKLPERYREKVKELIHKGEIQDVDNVRRLKSLTLHKPEKAEIEFLRLTKKSSEEANRILDKAVELGLFLRRTSVSKLSPQDKKMVQLQLGSLSQAIRVFLGKLKLKNH